MPTIQQLNSIDSLSADDYFPVYVQQFGDVRKATATTVRSYMTAAIASATTEYTQYFAPDTIDSIALDSGYNLWVLITPNLSSSNTCDTLEIILPDADLTTHGTTIIIFTTKGIAEITYDLNNAVNTVMLPSSISANSTFRAKYDSVTKSWYLS